MADKINAPVTSGFFSTQFRTSNHPIFDSTKETNVPSFVAVGNRADSAFKGAAVSMIDNIFSAKTRPHQDFAKKLLELHAKYFEQTSISVRLLTPIQHLEKLLEAPYARAKFINELAFALRQETVTELVQDPERYICAFFVEDGILTPEKMRDPSIQLDRSAMSALAKVMQAPLELYEVEMNKELRQRTSLIDRGVQTAISPIKLQLQESDYFPLVRKAEYFTLVNKYKTELAQPKILAFNDPDIAEIINKIKSLAQNLLQQFSREITRLNKMLQAGELTKADLLSIYIKNMPCADQHRYTEYVGIEIGNQQWFKRIKAVHTGIEPLALSDKQETNELVEALARGICTGEIEAAHVYEAGEIHKASLAF